MEKNKERPELRRQERLERFVEQLSLLLAAHQEEVLSLEWPENQPPELVPGDSDVPVLLELIRGDQNIRQRFWPILDDVSEAIVMAYVATKGLPAEE